ncbi:MAG: hypothetical protein NTW48_02230 [Chloroflexi bacterium]|nr:hypothetical protein [Chloroflexota bacterium]
MVGEWTDSRARAFTVTDKYGVSLSGRDGAQRYLLIMPGTPLRGQQLSDTEATIVVRM